MTDPIMQILDQAADALTSFDDASLAELLRRAEEIAENRTSLLVPGNSIVAQSQSRLGKALSTSRANLKLIERVVTKKETCTWDR